MLHKFKSKYRINSTRLKNWNYATSGVYFITICTKDKEHFFGKIENGEMLHNHLGQIAIDEWLKTISIRPDMNLKLGEFTVTPNHFHGIIMIGKNEFNSGRNVVCRDAMPGVSSSKEPKSMLDKFGPQSKNLSSIIRGYKLQVTCKARAHNKTFAWQTRFHDHIIRSNSEYEQIKNYISNNPKKWKDDRFYN